MIKVNELRVGNWVLASEGSEVWCCMMQDGRLKSFGIPITPEILVAAGFKFDSGLYVKGSLKDDNLFKVEFAGYHIQAVHHGYISIPYEYVHQLQNLYFALTGEELKIKLPFNHKR